MIYIKIHSKAVEKFIESLTEQQVKLDDFLIKYKFSSIESKLNFLFLFHTVNFAFWGNPDWTVSINNNIYKRTSAMIECLYHNYINNPPFLNWEKLKQYSYSEFLTLVQGGENLILTKERWRNVLEAATIISGQYDNNFCNFLEKSPKDAALLAKQISTQFPSFNDQSIYENYVIHFNKRAQVLVSHLSLIEDNIYKINNLANLTAFADYRLPQVLRHLGILEYSKGLVDQVDNQLEIEHDSTMEIEIRLATLHAVELIAKGYTKKYRTITSREIDSFLWQKSQIHSSEMKPHHRTKSIYY